MSAGKRDDPTRKWLQHLIARVGWQKPCVAMANKNARILWTVVAREAGFDAKHVSVKPPGKCKASPVPGKQSAVATPPAIKMPQAAACVA